MTEPTTDPVLRIRRSWAFGVVGIWSPQSVWVIPYGRVRRSVERRMFRSVRRPLLFSMLRNTD